MRSNKPKTGSNLLLALMVMVNFFIVPTYANETVRRDSTGIEVLVDWDASFLDRRIPYTWAKDPFFKKPGVFHGPEKDTKLQLTAVVHSPEGESLAIINDKTVFVNSIVDGYAVKQIGPNFVVVRKGNSLRELQLPPIENRVSSDISVWDRLPAVENDTYYQEKTHEDQ